MEKPDPGRDGRLRPAARAPREERTPPPALARLLMRDERSWTIALAPTVFWLMLLAIVLSEGASDTVRTLAVVLAVLTAVLGLWVVGRLLGIRRLLLEGIRVDGTVVAMKTFH